jgi:hypothetical protein
MSFSFENKHITLHHSLYAQRVHERTTQACDSWGPAEEINLFLIPPGFLQPYSYSLDFQEHGDPARALCNQVSDTHNPFLLGRFHS